MHIKFSSMAAGILLAAGAVACNNDKITSLNDNPNNPVTAPPGPVFTQAVRTSAATFVGNGFSLRQTEFVAQHWAEVQYPDEDRYARLGPADVQGTYNASYYTQIEDLKKVILAGLGGSGNNGNPNPAIYGPASVLQSWNYEYLTDTWGDIPYSQALTGDSVAPNFKPAYDTQKNVYAGMLATLTKATTDMAAGPNGTGFSTADPIYSGSVAKWEKFSNSLRARLAMRTVNKDPAGAAAALTAAFSAPGGVFTSNADNAQFAWPGDNVYNNPITDNFVSRDDHRVSNTFANILVGNNDPRTPILMQPTEDDPTKYAGMPNGLTASDAGTYFTSSSRPGAIFFPGATTAGTFGTAANKKLPSFLMTYAELSFIQAEAAERGIGGLAGTAATYYYNGIRASMAQWGVTDATAIATYLAQPAVAYQGGVAGLKQIAVQKWVALVTDGPQSWAEWRRTCQPSTIAAGPAAVVPYVPRRFQYSTTEYSVNPDEVAKAVADQGPDTFATRIWWDSAPAAAPTCS
jgi:hypothetical protein